MRLASPSAKWFRKWTKKHLSCGGGFRSRQEKQDLKFRAAELYRLGATPWGILGSASGRISGVVKNTPSGVGFGVGVTAVCGEPATPVKSWIRNNMEKSSCTVL